MFVSDRQSGLLNLVWFPRFLYAAVIVVEKTLSKSFGLVHRSWQWACGKKDKIKQINLYSRIQVVVTPFSQGILPVLYFIQPQKVAISRLSPSFHFRSNLISSWCILQCHRVTGTLSTHFTLTSWMGRPGNLYISLSIGLVDRFSLTPSPTHNLPPFLDGPSCNISPEISRSFCLVFQQWRIYCHCKVRLKHSMNSATLGLDVSREVNQVCDDWLVSSEGDIKEVKKEGEWFPLYAFLHMHYSKRESRRWMRTYILQSESVRTHYHSLPL